MEYLSHNEQETEALGQRLAAALESAGVTGKVCLLNCGGRFVTHGAVPQLYEMLGIDGKSVAKTAKELVTLEKRTT